MGRIRKVALAIPVLLSLMGSGCPDVGSDSTVFSIGGSGGGGSGGTTLPTISMTVSATPVPEGGQIDVKVTLSSGAPGTVFIPYTVAGANTSTTNAAGNECAAVGDFTCDYSIASANPLVIAAGSKVGHILIDVTDDPFEEEPDVESLTVTLGTPTNASVGSTSSVTAFITDNDSDGLDDTISGRVVATSDGSGVSGVTVTGGGQTTTTNSAGHYSLAAPTPGAPLVLTYTKAGFIAQNKTTEQFIAADSATLVNVHMVPNSSSTAFDPAVGGGFAVPPTSAQVVIAGGSLVKASDGSPPDVGTGSITITPIFPGSDTSSLPGIYRAQGPSSTVPFQTYGGLDVTVLDSGGHVLTLGPLQTASARIPVSTKNTTPPPNAELIKFTDATGLWTSDGANALGGAAPNQYYDSTLTHLGRLAAATAIPTTSVTGCVVDPTGSPVPDATVVAEGITYSGTTQVETNSLGVFTIPVGTSQTSFVTANKRTGVSNALVADGLATTLTPCLVVIPGAASVRLSWGQDPHDLDSHLMGPNQSSHTRWDGKGSLSALPFAALDVDDVTSFGPEITTIVKAAKNRQYSFYVQNFSEFFSPGMTFSPARVELYIKGEQTVFAPPVGESQDPNADLDISDSTITWHVFDLTTDANCDITVGPPPATPWLHLTETTLDDPAANPNPDNNATFCN